MTTKKTTKKTTNKTKKKAAAPAKTYKLVKCPHCRYVWIPRVAKPKECPVCKRYLK